MQVFYRVRVGCILNFLDCVESLAKCGPGGHCGLQGQAN
jgi:hypothetical protein